MSHTTIVTPERVCGDPITGSFGPDTVSTPPPPSPQADNMDTGDSSTSVPGPGEMNSGRENLPGDQISREDDPGSGDENAPPGSDNDDPPPPDSDEDIPPPEPDDDGADNVPPPPNPDEEVNDPAITLESLQTDLLFIEMVENASLGSQFSPAELYALRNPQETRFSPFDDKDLWLSISFYISSLNHAQSQEGLRRLS
jgi:hypothetical protein